MVPRDPYCVGVRNWSWRAALALEPGTIPNSVTGFTFGVRANGKNGGRLPCACRAGRHVWFVHAGGHFALDIAGNAGDLRAHDRGRKSAPEDVRRGVWHLERGDFLFAARLHLVFSNTRAGKLDYRFSRDAGQSGFLSALVEEMRRYFMRHGVGKGTRLQAGGHSHFPLGHDRNAVDVRGDVADIERSLVGHLQAGGRLAALSFAEFNSRTGRRNVVPRHRSFAAQTNRPGAHRLRAGAGQIPGAGNRYRAGI